MAFQLGKGRKTERQSGKGKGITSSNGTVSGENIRAEKKRKHGIGILWNFGKVEETKKEGILYPVKEKYLQR